MQLLLSYPWWFVAICLLAGFGYAYLLYKPQFKQRPFKTMAVLRFLSVSLLCFFLLGPVLIQLLNEIQKPKILMVLDESESIVANKYANYYKNAFLQNWLKTNETLGDDYEIEFLSMAKGLKFSDSIHFNQKRTNISQVFDFVNNTYARENIGAVILATDGIYNQGNNPIYKSLNKNTILYTIGLGDTILKKDLLIKEESINFRNKKVYISFDSSSLGDTISWVPYCEEFRKKHNCEVVVSTFKNFLFEKTYPNLKFVKPGDVVNNIHGMFKIGWFYDNNLEPEYPSSIPLQKAITNILGLPFQEIESRVDFNPKSRPIQGKYICIATNSTAGCKLWNYPNGWEILSENLIKEGYKLINISQNGDKIKGVQSLKDDSMENTMNVIHHSEFVIGLSSGLSWLSWALNKHVVMISNFTEPDHEFTLNCTRITNPEVCNGCWNNPMFKFDKGDWNWCPEHKGTERHFECHKSITPEMVINEMQHLIK